MANDLKYGIVTVELDSVTHPLNSAEEPVFVLRAQDSHADDVLDFYLRSLPSGDDKMRATVYKVMAAFAEWRAANPQRVKSPD